MTAKKFLRCVECNEIIPLSDCDTCPGYSYNSKTDTYTEIAKNDRKEFDKKHIGHTLEVLKRLDNTEVSDISLGELMADIYFEAETEDQKRRKYTINAWRKDINQPTCYRTARGRIRTKEVEIQVQADAFRTQIMAQDQKFFLSDGEIDVLLMALKSIAGENRHLIKEEDIWPDQHSRLIQWARLNDALMEIYLKSCGKFFGTGEKMRFIENFIKTHNEVQDVLNIRLKSEFWIEEI